MATPQATSERTTPRKNFFISYNRADRAWAEWIAWQLEEADYTTVLQAWDFRPGGNFVLDMQRAAAQAERTIAVLSEDFLAATFTQPEWAAAFVQDPTGAQANLVPVRVRTCNPQGLLRAITYIDLVDVGDEASAKESLLRGVSRGRARPIVAPRFPGARFHTVAEPGSYPGAAGAARDSGATTSEPQSITLRMAVVLTALRVEYQAVRAHLEDVREDTHPQGTVYERGKFATAGQAWTVAIVEIGAGNERAAAEAERAIQYFKPSVAMFVGVAGGIKDVGLGDVVVVTKAYGYHSGKYGETFAPRPNVGQSSYDMEQRARAEARKPDWMRRLAGPSATPAPSVVIAPIAAGEQVVASTRSATYQFLRSNYGDAVAVEMEGRGFLQAVSANQQVSALIIRGISDLIDDKQQNDAAGLQEVAARNASAFAFEVLANLREAPPDP